MDDDTIGSASLSKLSRLSTAIKDGTVSPTLAKKYAVQTNSRLIYVFSHLVKAFLETENEIQKSLAKMGLASADDLNPHNDEMLFSLEDAIEKLSMSDCNEEYFEDDANLVACSQSNGYAGGANMSAASTSFLELESLKDDVVLGFSQRLRSGVEKVLQVLDQNLSQHSSDELRELLRRNIELSSEVKDEARRRETLTKKLIFTEKDVNNLQEEKRRLIEQLQDYDENKQLVQSLQTRLDEYKRELSNLNNEKDRLQKSKVMFSHSLPQLEQSTTSGSASSASSNSSNTITTSSSSYFSFDNGESNVSLQQELMNEIDNSNQEIKKMESERRNYLQRIADLEQSLERVQHEHDQIISQKQNQLEDYRSQIESAQKQVAQYKRFIDEQTAEREQEREDYGREVQKLSEICTEKEKHESKLKDRVRTLEEQLNTNYEDKCRLQSSYEETKQRLSEATRSVNELQQVLSELERTNEKTVQAERQLNDKINRLESALTTQMRANEEMKKDHTDQSLLIAHSFIDEMLEKTERIRCASSTFDYRTSLMSITDLDVGSGDFNKSAIISGNNHDASSMESCRQASCGSTDPSTSCELIDGSTATNSFANTRLLEQKIRSFYDMIESLNRQNARLKGDLVEARDARSEYETRFEQLDVEKTRLERDLSEIRRTKQVLQEELNHKQKQLIGLKQRLDENASQETAQYRQAVDELRAELKREEDRCNDLNVRLAESVETLERKDAQLQSMTTRLDTLQREKSRIEGEHGVLQKTNHELTTQQRQLNDELQQLQSDLQKEKHDHQQTEQQEAVLPQLFAILLKDKEEEIEVLRRKLNQFQSRLRQLVPDSTTEDSMCLLNELQFRLRRYQDQEQTSKPTVCPVESGTSTTKPIMLNKSTGTSISRSALQSDKAINTDLDANAMSANDHDRMRQFVVSQLGDFIDQLEEQYTQLAAYQKDNELLRRRLSLGMDKNGGLLRSNSPDDSDLEIADDDVELADDDDDEDDPDSDTNDDDKIDDTLCLTLADVHNQSMELCKLTKRRCAQSAVVLRQLIAELPQLFVNDTDGSHPNREIDHNWQMKFVHNFPDREIGRLLVEKLVQIHDVHCSVRQRAQLSTSQLIFTQDKLAEAEKAIDRYKQMLESKRNDLSQYEMELKKLRKHGETLQSDRARCKQELAKNKEQINQLNRRLAENRSTNDPAADLNDTDAKDLYEQLRRVQAQRKALIFQKKYLMNVLSGLRQCAQPGDRTLNLITRLSCLLRPNELSRTIAANCEKMHVNRFKVVVYAVIAVRRLNRITSSKKPVTASANHRSTSIESSIPQMRHQQSDEAAYSCMYTPMSSTHVVGKSRSSVQLPSFSLNHQTERTYNMAGTKSLNKTKGQTRSNPITPSTDAGLACPATNSSLPSSTRPHPNQTKSVLLLNTFKKNATTSNNKQVDHVSKMNDCKSLDHSSQSPVSHHQHHSQPPQSTSSSLNRPDETTDDDPSLAQFYNELKRVHHVIGFDLSSTINSQNV